MKVIAGNLDEHEGLVLVEARGREVRALKIALPQLAAGPGDEVMDAALRLQTLVHMVVTGEHDLDAEFQKQRLEQHPKVNVRPVAAGVPVERMVEVRDSPGFDRLLERGPGPGQLRRVQHIGVQHHEPHAPTDVGVVAAPFHVDRRIVDRREVVVIAKGGSERHPGIEQRPIRSRELVLEIRRSLWTVEVVAQHQHQVERERLVDASHLTGHVELRLLAGAVVTDDGKLQRLGVIRELGDAALPSGGQASCQSSDEKDCQYVSHTAYHGRRGCHASSHLCLLQRRPGHSTVVSQVLFASVHGRYL